jgi:hypothetical protein
LCYPGRRAAPRLSKWRDIAPAVPRVPQVAVAILTLAVVPTDDRRSGGPTSGKCQLGSWVAPALDPFEIAKSVSPHELLNSLSYLALICLSKRWKLAWKLASPGSNSAAR